MLLDELKEVWLQPIIEWESIKETLAHLSASAKLTSLKKEDIAPLTEFLANLRDYQDFIVVKVFFCATESVEFSNRMIPEVVAERSDELSSEIDELEGDEVLSIDVEITKIVSSQSENVLVDNIYSIGALSASLTELSFSSLQSQFANRYFVDGINAVVFKTAFDEVVKTDYFHFIPCKEFSLANFKPVHSSTRAQDIVKIRANLGHFANASDWPFLPDHFKFSGEIPEQYNDISLLFNALHNAYLISFLANFSIVKDIGLEYSLKGLKNITGTYDFNALKHIKATPLWHLYQWIYEGNTVDKIGVTRNIIPLHVEDLLSVNDAVLVSAYSSFNLSQKDDVKSYIDSTNKLAEQLQNTSQKASDIAEKISNSIKTGLWGISTFSISAILIRVFGKAETITFHDLWLGLGAPITIAVFAFVMIVFSGLFGLACYESIKDQKRFEELYENQKDVYRNVLTDKDIDTILSNDKHFNSNNKYITDKRNLYLKVWARTMLIIVFILIAAFVGNLNVLPPVAS